MADNIYPYWNKDFFQFLCTLIQRLFQGFKGGLVSDEIQIGVFMLIGISTALVGSLLVLRKSSMIANALSHTILVGIVITYLIMRYFEPVGQFQGYTLDIRTLVLASLITSLITNWMIEGCTKGLRVQRDASIGLVFTVLFAIGIVAVTVFTRSSHIGVELIMGSSDALSLADLKLSFYICIFNAALFLLFYKQWMITSFDSMHAMSIGIGVVVFQNLLMIQTSATVIGSFRAVGIVLVLAYLVGPTLIARMWTAKFLPLIGLSIAISLFTSIVSVALSRHILI